MTIGEVTEQYVHNLSPRSYYVLKGMDIAGRNFPLGEGAYSTGPFTELLAHGNFKKKYNLSDEDLKTIDSFLAAILIEFGFLGTGLIFLTVLWLWKTDRTGLLRYMVILFGITAYSNADILTPMRAENILFFLAAGLSLSVRESYQSDEIGVPNGREFKTSRLGSTRLIA